MHSTYGGGFPNAPVLSAQDRHQLALLALGDKCPQLSFFRDFHELASDEPGTSSSKPGDDTVQPQFLPQSSISLPQDLMDVEQQFDAEVPTSSHQCREDTAEVLKQIQQEQWRHHSLAADNPFYLTILQRLLAEMKKVHREPQVMASYLATSAAYASARRSGRSIRVQPTGVARRRPGVTQGAARVHAGRPSKNLSGNKTKRAHNFKESVKSGVPHVKSHGTGH